MSQQPPRKHHHFRVAFTMFSAVILLAANVIAAPTQEETLQSISRSLGEEVDPTKALAVAATALGLLVLLVVLGMRSQREAIAKPVNHHGKLMREVVRAARLSGSEVRQLKLLAEQVRTPSGDQPDPMTMLLCPSLMSQAMPKAPRVDRSVLTELVRRMRAGE